jgi:hypothetical protein
VNDFHGYLELPAGSSGRIVDDSGTSVDAGGAEYLATHVKQLRKDRVEEYSMLAGAGDLVGGSPLLSALFHDEPTVEFFSSRRAAAEVSVGAVWTGRRALAIFSQSCRPHAYDTNTRRRPPARRDHARSQTLSR